jgi:uncharacterized protein
LAWRRLKKIISYAREREKRESGLALGMPTNGILLDEDILGFCRENAVKIAVSIDGDREANQKRRVDNKDSSYAYLEKKIDLFLKYHSMLRIRLTVDPEYAGQLYENIARFVRMGFYRLDIQPVIGVVWETRSISSFLHQLEKVASLVSSYKRQGIVIDIKGTREVLGSGKFKEHDLCPKITTELTIDTNGDIYPCTIFLGFPDKTKYRLGHISSATVDFQLVKQFLEYRICEERGLFGGALKPKCSSCHSSMTCRRICLGLNIHTRRLDPRIAANNWVLLRRMEKVLLMFQNDFSVNGIQK